MLFSISPFASLTKLQREQPALYAPILTDTLAQCRRWNAALLAAQSQLLEGNAFLDPDYQIKENCHVRFVRLPPPPPAASSASTVAAAASRQQSVYPTNEQAGRFVQVQGSVVRLSQAKLLELKREYVCSKCKHTLLVAADYARLYVIEAPKGGCPVRSGADACRGTLYQRSAQPVPEHCIDVQEIRIQEVMSERNMPASMVVTLDNDLVDSCQPGDCVTIW